MLEHAPVCSICPGARWADHRSASVPSQALSLALSADARSFMDPSAGACGLAGSLQGLGSAIKVQGLGISMEQLWILPSTNWGPPSRFRVQVSAWSDFGS